MHSFRRKRRLRHGVRSDLQLAVDVQQGGQPASGAAYSAPDRPQGNARHVSRLLVGHAVRSDQEQRLALFAREPRERRAEIFIIEVAVLLRVGLEPGRVGAVCVFHLTPAFAVLGVELITQDREEPRLKVRTALELVNVGPSPQQGVLHQIVGMFAMAGE